MNRAWYVILVVLGVSLISVFSFIAGREYEAAQNSVCVAATEDSTIVDCTYHNGQWWRK